MRIILIAGAESSGTRIFTKQLSLHPEIYGSTNALKHSDVLDELWLALDEDNISRAECILDSLSGYSYILTRRSMPHAKNAGLPAEYMHFPPINKFINFMLTRGNEVILLITTRSIGGNLASWTQQRSSAEMSIYKAKEQYLEAYKLLFSAVSEYQIAFFFLSLEALIYEREGYLNTIFHALGLPTKEFIHGLEINNEANNSRNLWFLKQSESSFFRKRDSKLLIIKRKIYNFLDKK